MDGFNLQRGGVVSQDIADFESPCFLVKNVYQINPQLNQESVRKKTFSNVIRFNG